MDIAFIFQSHQTQHDSTHDPNVRFGILQSRISKGTFGGVALLFGGLVAAGSDSGDLSFWGG